MLRTLCCGPVNCASIVLTAVIQDPRLVTSDFDPSVFAEPSEASPEDELQKLKRSVSGAKLLLQILVDQTRDLVDILYYVGQPCWTAHSSRARNVKNPMDPICIACPLLCFSVNLAFIGAGSDRERVIEWDAHGRIMQPGCSLC